MSRSSADRSVPSSGPAIDESLVGKRVGKYEIVRVIGRGGMGCVYEALNTAIGKRVAMKFVDAEMAKNRDAVARFQREAQAASAVESAHIVEIFDAGITDEGQPYLVMELLRGEDLGHRIKRCGRLELPEALHITAQILRGLHRAHEAGIVHRDLKPDNVFLVDRDDEPNFAKILDFGISKVQRSSEVPAHTLTRQGTVLGTPFYMSPEQAQALPDVDGRTDLWSVGAILYESLTGRPPHTGSTYEQVIINICMKDAEDVRVHNPAVPEPIAALIKRALTREREERIGSARELLDALIAAAPPGMLGARSGRSSAPDDNPHTSISARTPVQVAPAHGADTGFGPTIEVPSGMNASRVGWATSEGTARKQIKRLYAIIAVAGLSIGGVAAFLMSKPSPSGGAAAASAVPAPATDVTIRLESNAPGARFIVDGVPVSDGVIRGSKGTTRRVRVEAEGFAPVEKEVVLTEGVSELEIPLEPRIVPVVTPETGAGATPAASPEATSSAKAKPAPPGKGVRPVPPKNGEPTTTPPPPPPPRPTGVAGGLQIKTD